MRELVGTGVALVTPFTAEGVVDVPALERVVAYQIENGIDYLVILGTTGESVTLTKQEKQVAIDTVKKANAGKLPMVLGIGGNNTQAILDEIADRDLSDFTAILSVSPAYNKPTQEGIYQHFKAIARACPIPIVMYNVPGRTASNMLPETVARLAQDFDNIVAIKEAANDIVQAMQMIDSTPDDFLVISGDDILALPMTLAGGSGVISVIGQGFPQEFSDMIRFGLNREVDKAYKLHYKMAPCIDYIFAEGNPAGIKAVFHKLNICEPFVRLPLVGVSPELRSKIDDFADNV
ncbi:4-hydroxy-tetrahydrodipicolinate synthase [Aureisphaera galaxeae]|uniref:4-hydroxy-tetrahydrodipicolinate synthase n=1 Tax=Aureisphaera galaxeae TaxID=1538023 RepID=UPI0023505997|nr:4-hydroxy-tetrahydrodipicolinate synthase [Aureisphaera galaxeae]MDC8004973.1 4-hydroxy-tetrahydrodipicolinate synthase [Aureisphaera galaxeae]